MISEILEMCGLSKSDYIIKISSRKITESLFKKINVKDNDQKLTALRALDKIDRLGWDEVKKLLGEGRKDKSGDFTKGANLKANDIQTIEETLKKNSPETEDLVEILKIFKDYKIREKYNSIVHPEIFSKVKEYVKFHVSNKDHIIFFEGALIAKKTKIGKYLDKIILIKSRKDKIIARVSKRDGMGTGEIFNILEAQSTTGVNAKDFDYIINNNDKIDDFKNKLNSILEKISH